MIKQVQNHLLDTWSDALMGRTRPRRLHTLIQATGISKVCCYIFADDEDRPRWVAKIPRTPRDNTLLAHEYSVIRDLRNRGSDYVRSTTAGSLLICEIAGHLVGVEPYLLGTPMDGLMKAARTPDDPALLDNLEIGVSWLLRCQHDTIAQTTELTARQARTLLFEPISRLRDRCFLEESEVAYLDRLENTLRALSGEPLPLVFKHGDLRPGNMLLHRSDLHVIDWEFGSSMALPLHDLFGLLARTYARYLGMEEMDGSLEDYIAEFRAVFFEGGAFADLSRHYVQHGCHMLNCDPAWVEPLFAMFVVAEANKYTDLLDRRAEHGYLWLMDTGAEDRKVSYAEKVRRQKHVHLLGHLAEHEMECIFHGKGAPEAFSSSSNHRHYSEHSPPGYATNSLQAIAREGRGATAPVEASC